MIALPREIVQFFHKQRFVIVSTVDKKNTPHNSCKGIVDIDQKGIIYLLDLYRGKTLANLERNPNISVTVVDEHKFIGYCLKGIAAIVDKKLLNPHIIRYWEKKIPKNIVMNTQKNLTT